MSEELDKPQKIRGETLHNLQLQLSGCIRIAFLDYASIVILERASASHSRLV